MFLTKYKPGSWQELCALALPLMLSSLSVLSMFFVDRLLLARYNIHALNAAVSAGSASWACVWGWMVLTSMSEVFVAQYNGAQQYYKMGAAVWQMIWVALGSSFFFIPMAIWGTDLLYSEETLEGHLQAIYFRWILFFSIGYPLYSALCGFFIGQGKTHLITLLAIITNALNTGLDVLLIFGVEGWIPSLGIQGAAIATSGSICFQVIVLAVLFLRKSQRIQCGTGEWKLNLEILYSALKIGLPGALLGWVEVIGWSFFYAMMSTLGSSYMAVVSICSSVTMLLFFFCEGLGKAATAVAGNLVGSQRMDLMPKVVKAGLWLDIIYCTLMAALLLLFFPYLPPLFLPDLAYSELIEYQPSIFIGLMIVVCYIFGDGIRYLLGGILTAAGDTFFLMVSGSCSIWLLLVLPVYVLLQNKGSVLLALTFWIIYVSGLSLLLYARYCGDRWRTKAFIADYSSTSELS